MSSLPGAEANSLGRRISLFGAPGSNTNLGLNALMQGTLAAATRLEPGLRFTVFDNQLGRRPATLGLWPDGGPHFDLVGARLSRRVVRPESYTAMRASLAVGGWRNDGARAVLRSRAVWDVSGGDSFSDIYGTHRFRTVCAPKSLALRARRPLVLLPQTYGPFLDPDAAATARSLVLRSSQAWARDEDSYDVLRQLLGADFDAGRHRLGVDLATLLPAQPPASRPDDVAALLAGADGPVAVNVSGLLWNDEGRFGLTADYRSAMVQIVQRLVREGRRVLLVPHVLGRRPGGEADNLAGDALVAALPDGVAAAVTSVPWFEHAGEAKYVIAHCDFLVGTRMHSTIAALSSGIPCVAVAYSAKYLGVFSRLGVSQAVLDARHLTTSDLVDAVMAGFSGREGLRDTIRYSLPDVQEAAIRQMVEILTATDELVSNAP